MISEIYKVYVAYIYYTCKPACKLGKLFNPKFNNCYSVQRHGMMFVKVCLFLILPMAWSIWILDSAGYINTVAHDKSLTYMLGMTLVELFIAFPIVAIVMGGYKAMELALEDLSNN